MRMRDEQAWASQLTELEADEYTRKFKAFLLSWIEEAENILAARFPLTKDQPNLQLAASVSKALEVTEQTLGFLSIEWIAQMLLVITDYWTYGEALYEDLSHVERRLVDQAAAMKLADLQAAAVQTA